MTANGHLMFVCDRPIASTSLNYYSQIPEMDIINSSFIADTQKSYVLSLKS